MSALKAFHQVSAETLFTSKNTDMEIEPRSPTFERTIIMALSKPKSVSGRKPKPEHLKVSKNRLSYTVSDHQLEMLGMSKHELSVDVRGYIANKIAEAEALQAESVIREG